MFSNIISSSKTKQNKTILNYLEFSKNKEKYKNNIFTTDFNNKITPSLATSSSPSTSSPAPATSFNNTFDLNLNNNFANKINSGILSGINTYIYDSFLEEPALLKDNSFVKNDSTNDSTNESTSSSDLNNLFNVNFNNKSVGEHFASYKLKNSFFTLQNETIRSFDIQRVFNRNIRVINNVYQEKYSGKFTSSFFNDNIFQINHNDIHHDINSSVNVTGFGDFIRGCYFLLDFCSRFEFIPNVLINHPISYFLKKNTSFNLNWLSLFGKIKMLHNNNFYQSVLDSNNNIVGVKTDVIGVMADFVDYLSSDSVPVLQGNSNAYMYSICFPIEQNITQSHREFMQNLLEPNDVIKGLVWETINSLGFSLYKYSVIHVRSGDSHLKSGEKLFHIGNFYKLADAVAEYLAEDKKNHPLEERNYLIIADNNEIKVLLMERFPFLKCILKPVTHLGEGIVLEREKVQNTLVDFYLLSFANYISAYTFYEHGSGFSKWAAVTFNVPYYCRFIR